MSRRLAGRPRAVRRTWTDVLSTTLTVTRPLLSVQELAQCFGVSKQAAEQTKTALPELGLKEDANLS